MRYITNQFNYRGPKKEVNNSPSATVPDSTLPLRTLIERYVRGVPTHQKIPLWDSPDVTTEDYLPDPKTLDLAEREEMAQKYAEEIQAYKHRQQQFEAQKEAENALIIDSPSPSPSTETK